MRASAALLIAAAATAIASEEWDDFTNNLATDLAPLVALFGEQTTKQFLSESTSFLDSVIFAMAPLGILTAVVSVIRVLGSASLKAFVGRAQEGRGVAEVELCSSTSEDVCELWNRGGGITRVFGRPKIVEFVFDPKCQDTDYVFYGISRDAKKVVFPPVAGLYKTSAYEKANKPSHNGQAEDIENYQEVFAPNPNLSLNIGIRKRPLYILWMSATFGLLLQLSVLGYASWAVFVKNLTRRDDKAPSYKYFWVAATGTVLLVCGMILCAFLIDQSTRERTISVGKPVFWLQPGNQTIGEQNFEAFAYYDELSEYTTSLKTMKGDAGVRLTVWLAICTTMSGFILQFTGLRGLHASVALYQFAATIIMSFIRSLLRAKRLGEEENLLKDRDLQKFVEGHELDWLAFELDGPPSNRRHHRCDMSSRDSPLLAVAAAPLHSSNGSTANSNDVIANDDGLTAGTIAPSTQSNDNADVIRACTTRLLRWIAAIERNHEEPNAARRLLSYRSRLSCLTFAAAPTTSQQWELKSRDEALRLQTAIQSAAGYIFSDVHNNLLKDEWQGCNSFCWVLPFNVREHSFAYVEGPVPAYLMVFRKQNQWVIDLSSLEAVLGLWLWSVMKYLRMEHLTNDRRLSKKVFASISNSDPREENLIEKQLKLWVLRQHHQFSYHCPLGYQGSEPQSVAPRSAGVPRQSLSIPLWTQLLFMPQGCAQSIPKLLSVQTGNSLLAMLSQDIFTSFIDALAGISKPLEGISIVRNIRNEASADVISISQRQQFLGLANNHIDALVDIFLEAGLGSREDALLSIIPPFRNRSLLPSLASEKGTLIEIARGLRAEGKWPEAEDILIALCFEDGEQNINTQLLKELCELYRKAMRSPDPSRRSFGYSGISQVVKMVRSAEVIQYQWAAGKLAKIHREEDKLKELAPIPEQEAFDASLDGLDLYQITQQTSAYPTGLVIAELFKGMIESDTRVDPPVLIWGVKKDCLELVGDLLDAGVDINVKDSRGYGRTALSYACEEGDERLVKLLLDAGASTAPIDTSNRSRRYDEIMARSNRYLPVLCAARHGHVNVMKLLIKANAHLEAKDRDGNLPLSLAATNGHEAVVKLLLETDKVSTNSGNRSGQYALLGAAENGHVEIARVLLEVGKVDPNFYLTPATPLGKAAENGHEAVVKLLLETGKVKPDEEHGSRDETPLYRAAVYGHDAVVRLLLDASSPGQDSRSENFQRSLGSAARAGHDKVVRQILDTGKVDPDEKNELGETPLWWAAGGGYDKVVQTLLDTGEVNPLSNDRTGNSPLMRAARFGHESVVKVLLNATMDDPTYEEAVNAALLQAAKDGWPTVVQQFLNTGKVDSHLKNENGQTPLHLAAVSRASRTLTVVQLLLQTGKFDPDSKDLSGETPLSKAASIGSESVVELLLRTGEVDPDSKDLSGKTPLSKAASIGSESVVELLLGTGKVDPNSRDEDGRTPLSQAVGRNHESIVLLLFATGKIDLLHGKSIYGETPLQRAEQSRPREARSLPTSMELLLRSLQEEQDRKERKEPNVMHYALDSP